MRTRSLTIMTLLVALALVLTATGCKRAGKTVDVGLDGGKTGASSPATGAAGAGGDTTGAPKATDGSADDAKTGADGTDDTKTGDDGADDGKSGDDGTDDAKTDGTGGTGGTGGTTGATAESRVIRILWWNDTVKNAPEDPEVVFGEKVFKPISGESDVGSIGAAEIGKELTLTVYPDGRSGKALKFTFEVTPDMTSDSEVDGIHVEVSDDKVRVLGNPVINFTQSQER